MAQARMYEIKYWEVDPQTNNKTVEKAYWAMTSQAKAEAQAIKSYGADNVISVKPTDN